LSAAPQPIRAQTPHPTDTAPINLAEQSWFFVGGHYEESDTGAVMVGQEYVEKYVPVDGEKPVPVVMIHGGGQTGTNFTGTSDGRRGWAHDFLRAGYTVYVVDQPGRARSNTSSELYGKYNRNPTSRIEQRFTAPQDSKLWPQAVKHTQWPGSGHQGDPAFDQFYASQVEGITDGTTTETLNRDAGAALLDRIGPAILLVHSQSGSFAWLIADARPDLVKGIINIEPNGPPLQDVNFKGAPDWFDYSAEPSRVFGIARIPLTYDPSVADASELKLVQEDEPEAPDLVRCYEQASPARQLPNLKGIPILIVSSESSYHAAYDHCTSRYLTDAGVENEFVRLEDRGISGNGHMMMIEKNNHEVADLLIEWLAKQGI
jgi:pimeloyl-ACP methyl ester carboxylesterase